MASGDTKAVVPGPMVTLAMISKSLGSAISVEQFVLLLRAGAEGRFDFVFMVDEPLHVASRRRVSGAGAMLAVACVVCVGPLSRATRVSAVVCPRFCAQVGQSAREGRSPLSGVS